MENKEIVEEILKRLYSNMRICDKESYTLIAEYVLCKLEKKMHAIDSTKEVIQGEDFMNLLTKDEQMKIFIKLNK